MSTQDLHTAIQNFTAAIKNRAGGGGGGVVFNNYTGISANGSMIYAMPSKIGTESADYDYGAMTVEVKILDTTPGSRTNGYYVNSEGSVTVGTKSDGTVRIINHIDASIELQTIVTVPLKTTTRHLSII